MTGETWTLLIVGGVVPLLGALAFWLRARAAKRDEGDEPKTVVKHDESTGVEDTGRFLVALREAPAPVLEDMARSLREIADTKPATREDLRREVGTLKDEINGRLDTHSLAIGGLRKQIVDLPCMQDPPEDCPAIPGGSGRATQ